MKKVLNKNRLFYAIMFSLIFIVIALILNFYSNYRKKKL